MSALQQHTKAPSGQRPRPASTTSPPGGKVHEATKPPAVGELDQGAVEKGWQKLLIASGGH